MALYFVLFIFPEGNSSVVCFLRADGGVGEGSQGDGGSDSLSPVLFEDDPVSPPGEPVVFGPGVEEAVREMRFRIEQRTSLTASAGDITIQNPVFFLS